MKQTPLFIKRTDVSGNKCWQHQPMVSSDALTERTHQITEVLN